ncbi:hypothetical protein CASFOL_010732 [Castilleja foliolosa]|uniref:Phytocyanin domain-containing protein n=1 Tax=Castilleja foliolosa TaxID=1961234 RepID=A0ABD3DU25_9LAMI
MGMRFSGALFILVVTTSILGIAMAAKTNCTNSNSSSSYGSGSSWSYSYSSCAGGPKNDTPPTSRKINIHWIERMNYQIWTFKNEPIQVNDILVFKLPHEGANYNVSVMKDMPSYFNCDFAGSTIIENTGDGLSFKLEAKGYLSNNPNYFFATKNFCRGGMKLWVTAMPRW